MRILALQTSHDASVCSIVDGKIEFFCKEERVSRKKRDKDPFKSLELYKQQEFGPVDHILWMTPTNDQKSQEYVYGEYLRKTFGVQPENYASLKHHECHASLAFYNSGFEEALTFVIDRNGSVWFSNGQHAAKESETVFRCRYPDDIIPLHKNFFAQGMYSHYDDELAKVIKEDAYQWATIEVNKSHGIVKVYESATTLIGQNALENGKTMGLSAYSSKEEFDPLFKGYQPLPHNFTTIAFPPNGDLDTSCFAGMVDKITDDLSDENYEFYADCAKHVQVETQKAALDLIKKYVEKTGIKNVCIVGGYGLNVVANQYYIKNLPDVKFYFEPVADDTGVPIGAAMLKYREITKDETINPVTNNSYHFYKNETLNIGDSCDIDKLASLLEQNKSIAIFDAAPESGPRALGNRSILFDARNKDSKDLINKVKNREWYRPFAGIVLKERFSEYFDTLGLDSSPHMTISFDAKKKAIKEVPGVIHADGTCRIQTVEGGFVYDLLKRFNERTGCGILLNTSFNMAGDPLIQTKKEALNMLEQSDLDYVYFVDEEKLVSNDHIHSREI